MTPIDLDAMYVAPGVLRAGFITANTVHWLAEELRKHRALRVEIEQTPDAPATVKVWYEGVLRFSGITYLGGVGCPSCRVVAPDTGLSEPTAAETAELRRYLSGIFGEGGAK